jgi:glutamate 5-kinase
MNDTLRFEARDAKRIVVKVGSGVLSGPNGLRPRAFSDIARQVVALMDEGRSVALVSSGAIAAGARRLAWDHPGQTIPEKQAAAAVGQIALCETYQRNFAKHSRRVGQVLLTQHGLTNRERFLNARHTLHKLLELGVVPIVNENDTVATEEIRFGDNDNLSATVVNLVGADLLVILTDVDGLYESPPQPRRRKPRMLDIVNEVTPELERSAGGAGHAFGRGGMITKLQAARSASHSGAATVICNAGTRDSLVRVAAGEPLGTLFRAGDRLASRKHWLAFTARPAGTIVIDSGAAQALREAGRSLLPAGIVAVRGNFSIGDPVLCSDPGGREVARGLAAYASTEVDRIKGLATSEIGQVLGYSNGDAVIHRDDLVVLDSDTAAPAAAGDPTPVTGEPPR